MLKSLARKSCVSQVPFEGLLTDVQGLTLRSCPARHGVRACAIAAYRNYLGETLAETSYQAALEICSVDVPPSSAQGTTALSRSLAKSKLRLGTRS